MDKYCTRRFAYAASIALAATLGASAVQDVKVNADAPGTLQNEVVLAVDLAIPTTVVVAYNDRAASGSPSPLGISASADGGTTWTDTQLTIPPDPFMPGQFLNNIFDPYLAWGPPQEMYAGYIATIQTTGGQSGIFIERSEDGGLTWSGPTTIALDGPAGGPVNPNYRFNDRPHITTDPIGSVNVTWIKDVGVGLPTSDIYYAFSMAPPGPGGGPFPPTGLSFTAPVTVNDSPNGIDMGNAPHVAVHPSGKVYVAWIDVNVVAGNPATGTLLLDTTATPTFLPVFGPDVTVRTIDPLPKFLSKAVGGPGNDARAGSYPSVAVDGNDGTGNTLYIAYAEEVPGDEADVFLIASTDGGGSWSPRVRVNDDSTTNDQFHPQVEVAPDSTVIVTWYDKRNSPGDDSWDVYAARSVDGGLSVLPNFRVSDTTAATPLNGTSPWLGEYLGLASDGTDVLVAFTTSVGDGWGDVYFDRFPTCAIPAGSVYCTAKVNSQGCTPSIGWAGCHPSASLALPFNVTASNVLNNKNGILFYGYGAASNPFQGGFVCVSSPVTRTPVQGSGGNPPPDDCSGSYSLDLSALVQSGGDPGLVAGASVHCEYWSRDPNHPVNASGLSDALRTVIQP